jgi:tetratricopeptide (TPR) repeat protein
MPCARILFLCFLLVLWRAGVSAQSKTFDSLRRAYAREKADTAKANILWEIAGAYAQNKPDSELLIAQQELLFSRKIKYVAGEMQSLKLMAEGYQFLGNYPLALQYYLQRLKLDEKSGDPETEVVTLLSIANLYQYEGDYSNGLIYAKKGYALIDKHKLEDYRWYSYGTFGYIYDNMNDIPDAILYNKKAYDLALKNKNGAWLGQSYNNSANTFVKAKLYPEALTYYRKGIPYLKANNNQSFLCESYQGIASLMLQSGRLDSALIYAKNSLDIAVSRRFNQKYLRSCLLLTDIYKAHHLADSALVYQGKLLVMKDSINSQEKEKQVANLTISEELRQKERLQEKIEDEKERSYKLNLLLVGLLIPLSFLVSLILSKKKMHPRVIEFSGIISLLLLFEYLTIFLHPIVISWTNHSPFLEIVIFVAIAAVLTPSHHKLEHWMLHKLTAHHHHPADKHGVTAPVKELIKTVGTAEENAVSPENSKTN